MLESLFNKVSFKKFIKKRLQNNCFPVNIAKLLRTSILDNICERQLLLLSTRSKYHQPLDTKLAHCIKYLLLVARITNYSLQKSLLTCYIYTIAVKMEKLFIALRGNCSLQSSAIPLFL